MAETITMEINDPIVRMEEEVHDIEEVPTKLVEEEEKSFNSEIYDLS